MRTDVLILLNEREPLKLQRAAELEQQLRSKLLVVERLEPSPLSAAIISERAPRVLILDYLLGDFGTALDILQGLERGPGAIQSVIWTDEPSVYAAVSVLKLGARDYIKLDAPRAVEQVIEAVDLCLNEEPLMRPSSFSPSMGAELVYQAPSSRGVLEQASAAARRSVPVLVLEGPHGCGRTALSSYIHRRRTRPGIFQSIEWDLWGSPAAGIFRQLRRDREALISHHATVSIDHAEYDTGELLEAAEAWAAGLSEEHESMLIVGTSCSKTARAWSRLTGALVLNLPGLSERPQDLFPLLMQIRSEAGRQIKGAPPDITAGIARRISMLKWPGNIKELRAVLLEAFFADIQAPPALEPEDSELTDQERSLLAALYAAKERWERFDECGPSSPDPEQAATALSRWCGNRRFAAAELGCGVPQITTRGERPK